MSFCASCAADIPTGLERFAPIGKNDAMVRICPSCDGDTPREARGFQRGYEGGGSFGGLFRKVRDAKKRLVGDETVYTCLTRAAQPGWIIVRVAMYDVNGRSRDRNEAEHAIAGESWFGVARYLGHDGKHHLFERPPRTTRVSDADPLAALEPFRATPGAKP